jgi:hypothetical protein
MRIADFMVRDPFHRPRMMGLQADSELAKVVRSLFPMGVPKADAVLIANRATHPKNVIDAKPDGTCERCLEAVWLAPSSKRSGLSLLTLCMDCLERGWALR